MSRNTCRCRLFGGIAVVAVLAAYLFAPGCKSDTAPLGKWRITSVAGRPPQNPNNLALEFVAGNKYSSEDRESGTWTRDGSTVTLHKEAISGMNRQDFADDFQRKHTLTPGLQRKIDALWQDSRMTLSSDGATMTFSQPEGDVILKRIAD